MHLATVEKQQRHESILLSLKRLGYLSRSQIQRLHRLGSVRNANRVISDLRPYLSVIKRSEYVYTLNAEGRRMVGAKQAQIRVSQVDHHIMRNHLYLALGCPATWRAEVRLKVGSDINVIADAIFERDGRYHIIEIDNTQSMAENRTKIDRYRKMLEMNVFKKQPHFTWLTTTVYRRKELTRLCEGLSAQVYTVSDFK